MIYEYLTVSNISCSLSVGSGLIFSENNLCITSCFQYFQKPYTMCTKAGV